MYFVKRDEDGNIVAISSAASEGYQEEANLSIEELDNFIQQDPTSAIAVKHALQATDAELARVTEDLINLLIEKQIILFTELPNAVQEKLLSRDKLRKTLQDDAPSIVDDAGSI